MVSKIGILPGPRVSLIDHLGPLCALLKCPMLCTHRWIYELTQIYYPDVEVKLAEPENLSLDEALEPYETFVYVDHYRKHTGSFQFDEYTCQKRARSICGLHGNSDKKRNIYWIEQFADEDLILLYGQHMVDFVKEKGIWGRFNRCIMVGNYRWHYYQKHRTFFDRIVQPHLFPKNGRKTILYAPTWTFHDRLNPWSVDYSSFFRVHAHVLGAIPDPYQVLVKLHPFMPLLFPDAVAALKEEYQEDEQVRILDDVPPIHPLLTHVDLYLGDYSSIGYDFLRFDRPLFFLNAHERDPEEDKGVLLYRCGTPLSPKDFFSLFSILDQTEDTFGEARQKMYAYAFGEERDFVSEIEEALA